ncbi:MAG TPA: DUF192 domain-containing protein [Gaiellales bacterium]|nr:DUF192 domain-containing protein [Gaiellales bacterium]
MPRIRLERGPVVCERGVLAVTAWTRTKGLLGRSGLDPDEGLWIQPTGSIHMWFMRFPIDVVYADKEGRVLKLVHGIGPWRMSGCRGAKVALELPVGAIDRAGVEVGDHLVIEHT